VDWQATYDSDSLDGGVAKQRFACVAEVTLANIHDDAEDDDDGRIMQRTVVLSITAAAAGDSSSDWLSDYRTFAHAPTSPFSSVHTDKMTKQLSSK